MLVELKQVLRFQLVGHQEEDHVADDFAGRGNLDNVAKKLIDLGVHSFDLAPAMAEAHGGCLFAEIRVLAAGDFVLIQTRGAGSGSGVEGEIVGPYGFPVVRAFVECFDVELGVAGCVTKGRDDRVEIGLASPTAHGGEGGVGNIDSSISGFENRGGVEAAGVVGMEVNGDGNFVTKSADKLKSSVRFAKASHVFDGKKMGAEL